MKNLIELSSCGVWFLECLSCHCNYVKVVNVSMRTLGLLLQGGNFRLSLCPEFLFAAPVQWSGVVTSMSQSCNIGNEKCLHNNQTPPHLTLSSWPAINYQFHLQRRHTPRTTWWRGLLPSRCSDYYCFNIFII